MKKDVVNAVWPVGGVTRRTSLQSSSPFVCYDALNVFPDCSHLERERGGSRAPLVTDWSVGDEQINLMCEVGWINGSGDVERVMCVGDRSGELSTIAQDSSITNIGAGLNTGSVLTADAWGGKLFIARGDDADESIKVFDPSAGSLSTLTATAGTAPIKSKILIQWRDRIVVADGEDPHVIYMSRQGDPYDWDYTAEDVQRAVDFSATPAGRIGRPVRALIPHSNNCLIIATDNEFYVLRGDPTAGGRVMLIQNVLGIMGRRAWCHSPDGFLWVMTHDGLYVMPPGCGDPLYSVSREKLPMELVHYDPNDFIVTMAYCPRMRGVFVFMTEDDSTNSEIDPKWCGTVPQGSTAPVESTIKVTHFFCDIRNSQSSDTTNKYAASFWPLSIGAGAEPTYSITNHTVGNEPATFFGTRGGKVSHFERVNNSKTNPGPPKTDGEDKDDEGGAFHSYCMFGPFTTGSGGAVGVLEQIRAFMSFDSKPVEFEIYAGDDAETALVNEPVLVGKFELQGTNYAQHVRIRSKFFYVLIKDIEKETWSFESMQLKRQYRPGRERIHWPLQQTEQLIHDPTDTSTTVGADEECLIEITTNRDYAPSKTFVTWRLTYATAGVSQVRSIIYIDDVITYEEIEDLDAEETQFQYTKPINAGLTEGQVVKLCVDMVSGQPVTVRGTTTATKLNIMEMD